MREIQAVAALAYRDLIRFLRDRPRMVATLIFPLVFVGVLGTSLESNIGGQVGFNFLTFTFTGVLAQTLFQSTAAGIISLIEDRENNFSQEIFVSPITRYTIIIGKIMGETLVSLAQGIGIILFGMLIGIPITFQQMVAILPALVVVCFLGGAFGILVLSNLSSQRASNQIFPFVILPQFFLAGVFNPITDLPLWLWILSRIAPMTYAVDLLRSVFYQGTEEYGSIVLMSTYTNLAIITSLFVIFLVVGTYLFMRNERNR
jgi:ABC-2 type transport system permease protein